MCAFAVFFSLLLGYGSLNAQIISTIAGNGTPTSTGDGGLATAATVNTPTFITTDASGNIYFPDYTGNKIRKITIATGIITTIAGTGVGSFTGDGGLATAATIYSPWGIAIDASGNIYIGDRTNYRVRKITASTGIISTICGTGVNTSTGDGGLATAATINDPGSLFFDTVGNLYITEIVGHRIRKITTATGIITTICGNGINTSTGDGGLATAATINQPFGGSIDASDNIYIGELSGNRVRKITASTGIITTICGNGGGSSTGDGGLATAATIVGSFGMYVDKITGDIYIAEGSRIRKITASTGIISTICGTGANTSTGDGGPATAATISSAMGIHYANSKLYIGEYGGNRIRQFIPCPTITISPASLAGGTIGTAYSQTLTQTGLAGTPTWAIFPGALPAGLTLNSSTGVISGTPTTTGTPTFTVRVGDSSGCTQTKIYSIGVVCPTVTVTPAASTLSFTVGTAISNITLGASGVSGATYTYAVTSGALPAGVTLSAGVISGTPTTATAATSFTITATASIGGCTGTVAYGYSVVCPTLVFGVTTATGATVGTAYNLNAGVTGNTQSVVYTVSSLPAGLSISSTTGAISGTPTTATASATYTVTATQGTCSVTQGYTFAVVCPAVTITPTPTTQSYVVGTPISSITLGASGVSGATYAYTVTSGALPAGVTLSAGVISGTPTTATTATSFTITATASIGGCTGTAVYNYSVVCPTLVFGVTTATGATVGTAYSLNAGVTGNTASVVYTISSLPAGLSISSTTGAISGTPTAPAASATYTVTATQGTCSLIQGYTFAVACVGITITPATLANSVVGTAYSQTLTQVGLTGTPTWSVSVGTLPAGLTLVTTTGVISGTPTTAGTSNFTINLTNGAGCTQTKVYSIVVACPTLVFGVTTATGGIVATAYSLNAGVTGNTGTIVYSVLPALPAGLSINAATGAISGTPTAITASATYVVTATQTVACFATQSYTFGIIPNCTPVVLGTAALADAIVGTPYTHTFTATGGSAGATYTFSTSVALPAGLSLDASTGLISGTPTLPANVTFLVTAKTPAPNNCSTTIGYNLTVKLNAITSVDNSLANFVKVSPNPSNGDFNVDFGTINMAKSSVSVYDAQGKTVFTSENNNSANGNLMTISLDKFANGIYLLEVKTDNGRITKRLAKQ